MHCLAWAVLWLRITGFQVGEYFNSYQQRRGFLTEYLLQKSLTTVYRLTIHHMEQTVSKFWAHDLAQLFAMLPNALIYVRENFSLYEQMTKLIKLQAIVQLSLMNFLLDGSSFSIYQWTKFRTITMFIVQNLPQLKASRRLWILFCAFRSLKRL